MVKTGVVLYLARTALYVGSAVFLAAWFYPRARELFLFLKAADVLGMDLEAGSANEPQRTYLVRAFRRRAARKRVESYAWLFAALVALTVAVGFVTREHLYFLPEVIEPDTASTADTLATARELISEAQDLAKEVRSDLIENEGSIRSLIESQLETDAQAGPSSTARAEVLRSLASRPSFQPDKEFGEAMSVARGHIDFATKQLEFVNRQAELEVIRDAALTVASKIAALVLIMSLVVLLARLYRTGLALSVQYEAMADAIFVGPEKLELDTPTVLTLFTPALSRALPNLGNSGLQAFFQKSSEDARSSTRTRGDV
ncbi:hypothetical protein C666_17605 [Thauera linaloolentis 47Lol = DSM 12138]|uniref:Uncharacterized protein n=2 Tax=Thauera linaloolentis TaxID=76112 RepID=N6YWF6_THAL4|nr:hypothetical protein C666_17605 [Thauera linaloolentis 47Lol = DSM 12138]